MYVSHKYQIQWWFPMHVGSTVTRFLLEDIGFVPHWGQHPIDPECEYDIYVNIRNPYTLTISSWKNNQPRLSGLTFTDFVKKYKGEYPFYPKPSEMDYVEHSKNRKIKKIIRQENLYDDLTSIEFIIDNKNLLEKKLIDIKNKVSVFRGEKIKKLGIENLYNEDLANIVYDNREKFFKVGGYEKDSWINLKY
jgi:hypothetical protein